VTLKLEGGQSPAMAETTDEMPSQAQLLGAQNTFVLPPGATGVHVSIAPVDPPTVPPIGGGLDGNVYRFTVAALTATNAPPVPLQLRPGQQVTVVLRGPAGASNPVLELFNGTAWTKVDTQPLGNTAPDSYAANVTSLGDIALVLSTAAETSGSGSGNGGGGGGAGVVVAAVIVGVVLAGAAAVLVLRVRPGRGRTPGR
jgi:hypothetical protein